MGLLYVGSGGLHGELSCVGWQKSPAVLMRRTNRRKNAEDTSHATRGSLKSGYDPSGRKAAVHMYLRHLRVFLCTRGLASR